MESCEQEDEKVFRNKANEQSKVRLVDNPKNCAQKKRDFYNE